MALVTYAGDAIVTNRLKGSGTEPNFVGWGTGTTAEAKTQTALVTASAEGRATGTSSRVTSGAGGTNDLDIYQVVATITSASAQTINEVGLFDASTAGNMFVRGVHGATTLAIGDSITYTISVTFN